MTLSELFERSCTEAIDGARTRRSHDIRNLFDCHLTSAFGKIKVKELK
jgi:hypothetical protein